MCDNSGMKTRDERRSVNAGAEFAVRFEVVPTSGFAWHLMDCPVELDQIGAGYEPIPEDTVIPAGGTRTQIFRFLAMTRGTYPLIFDLKRTHDVEPMERLQLRVSVR
jgi:predicted secreted protein